MHVDTGFPDIENVCLSMFADVATVVTSTGTDLATGPTVKVNRIGGADDRIIDYPQVRVACFAPTREQAWAMAEQCRQITLASIATETGGALIDWAETITPTVQQAYENPDVAQVVAVYRFQLRRPFWT